MKWKLIGNAPHDKRILVWTGQEIYAAHWVKHPVTGDEAFMVGECINNSYQLLTKPTHWMLLPEPPTEDK